MSEEPRRPGFSASDAEWMRAIRQWMRAVREKDTRIVALETERDQLRATLWAAHRQALKLDGEVCAEQGGPIVSFVFATWLEELKEVDVSQTESKSGDWIMENTLKGCIRRNSRGW